MDIFSVCTERISKLLSYSLTCLDFADCVGNRGGHSGNGIIVASTVAVVVTYNLTNNVFTLASCKDTADDAVNGAIGQGVAGHVVGVARFSANVADNTTELITALNGNVGQRAV